MFLTLQNSFAQKKAIFNENRSIKILLLNYTDAIEKKDYKKMENYLTDDYEYYCVVRHKSNKKQYIKIVERNLKKYKNIKVTISNIEIFPDNETPHDLKVIYLQTIYKGKHVNRVLKTVRVFKGKETGYRWKIYREIDDKAPDQHDKTFRSKPVEGEIEIHYEESNFVIAMFIIGDIICGLIFLSFMGMMFFIFYKSIRLYIFKK